jgi:tetratricopeptide (TPR) repeat protein
VAALVCLAAAQALCAGETDARSVSQPDADLAVRARALAEQSDWTHVRALLEPAAHELDDALAALLARACTKLGDARAARDVLQRALSRFPSSEPLWIEWTDEALARTAFAVALSRVSEARRRGVHSAALAYRAAVAHFELGEFVGRAAVREIPGGRPGQFCGPWLAIEPRGAAGEFLCCPERSALFQLRAALDSGFNEPAAHLLHARIWLKLGNADAALSVLENRRPVLMAADPLATLQTLAEAHLARNDVAEYVRCACAAARRQPERTGELMLAAYRTAAQRCNERGDSVGHCRFLRQAVELCPTDVETTLRLADALHDAGRADEAREWYRTVLSLAPEHADRERILNRIGG